MRAVWWKTLGMVLDSTVQISFIEMEMMIRKWLPQSQKLHQSGLQLIHEEKILPSVKHRAQYVDFPSENYQNEHISIFIAKVYEKQNIQSVTLTVYNEQDGPGQCSNIFSKRHLSLWIKLKSTNLFLVFNILFCQTTGPQETNENRSA